MSLIPEPNGIIESATEPIKNRRKYWLNTTNGKIYILENNTYRLLENEVITNSNGTAIKYPDGYMFAFIGTAISNLEVKTPCGSLFNNIWKWNFPVSFVENPFVSVGQFQVGTEASWGTVAGANTQYANLKVFSVTAKNVGEAVSIRAMAFGKWK